MQSNIYLDLVQLRVHLDLRCGRAFFIFDDRGPYFGWDGHYEAARVKGRWTVDRALDLAHLGKHGAPA